MSEINASVVLYHTVESQLMCLVDCIRKSCCVEPFVYVSPMRPRAETPTTISAPTAYRQLGSNSEMPALARSRLFVMPMDFNRPTSKQNRRTPRF